MQAVDRAAQRVVAVFLGQHPGVATIVAEVRQHGDGCTGFIGRGYLFRGDGTEIDLDHHEADERQDHLGMLDLPDVRAHFGNADDGVVTTSETFARFDRVADEITIDVAGLVAATRYRKGV